MSDEAKQDILDKHNELRRRVAKGEEPGQPEAANMRKMVWNNELEAIAQRWADQCRRGHDKERDMLDGTWVGQNAYWGGSTMEHTLGQVEDLNVNKSVQAW